MCVCVCVCRQGLEYADCSLFRGVRPPHNKEYPEYDT